MAERSLQLSQLLKDMLSSIIFHSRKFDFTDIGIFRKLIKHRAFHWAMILPNLFIFIVVVFTGFLGTPVGNMNFSIVFVWILWWFALIVVMLPFMSRFWCLLCPLPAFGDWLQRRRMIWKLPGFKWFGQNKPWPAPIKNIWLQNIGFLFLATFVALMVTRPIVTAILLTTLFILGTVLAIRYAKRAFCRYVCPVAGFLGLYSMWAAFEIRSKDKALCDHHITKECVKGSDTSFGCPWFVYPGGFDRNNYCGLCMECVKACPYDNLGVRVRRFGADILVKTGRALDEAFKAFIMLTLAVVYIVVTQGPWAYLRDWANVFYQPTYGFTLTGLQNFAIFAAIVWPSCLIVTPGIFYFFTWMSKALSKAKVSTKKLFVAFSYELIPIGLAGWTGFSIPLLLVNWAYIVNVISDPFGWGWNLLYTRDIPWNPIFPQVYPYAQVMVTAIGLVYSIYYGLGIARQHFPNKSDALRAFIPQAIFLTAVSLLLVWLFTG